MYDSDSFGEDLDSSVGSPEMFVNTVYSLQELCLREVIGNFDMYSACYRDYQGTALGKQLEFLKRRYSEEIFHGLKVNNLLQKEHLDLLVNPYLKHLDLFQLDDAFLQNIASKLKTNGNGIISVKAWFSTVLYEHIIPSSALLEQIEIGVFRDIQVTHAFETIKMLGKYCPALKILKLNVRRSLNCDDTVDVSFDDTLDVILSNTFEISIFIDELLCLSGHCWLPAYNERLAKFYEGVCLLLDSCPSLQVLENINVVEILYRRHKVDFENNDLEKLRKYSLSSLSFRDRNNYPLSDVFEICYALCPKVSHIQLYDITSDSRLLGCPDFELLDSIKILNGNTTIDGMEQFLKVRGKKLVSLELYESRIPTMTIVECCPKLKSLVLSSIWELQPLSDNDFSQSAGKLPNLESFVIANVNFSWMPIPAVKVLKLILSAASNLQSITFESVVGFHDIFNNSALKYDLGPILELTVRDSVIKFSTLVNLLTQGNLRKLKVLHCFSRPSNEEFSNLHKYKRDNQDVEVK